MGNFEQKVKIFTEIFWQENGYVKHVEKTIHMIVADGIAHQNLLLPI